MSLTLTSLEETLALGQAIGEILSGGEVFELIGDVGSGKTAFTKGLARGLGVDDDVQSPSFTISRVYDGREGLKLMHYDFYRLPDPGIMAYDIAEAATDPRAIVVVEWGETVESVLPPDRTIVTLEYGTKENERLVTIQSKVTALQELYVSWHKN